MSCKAAIYTANTGAQAVAVGGTSGLGSIIRRFGNSCCNPIINLNGSGITLDEPSYYKVSVSAVANPTTAGSATLALCQDGLAVLGGVATGTAAATGNAVNLNIESIVKVRCGSTGSLTVQLTAGAGDYQQYRRIRGETLMCSRNCKKNVGVFDAMGFLQIVSLMLGYQNLLENRQQSAQNDVQSANDRQAEFLPKELGRKFGEQNEMLRKILEVITSEKPT